MELPLKLFVCIDKMKTISIIEGKVIDLSSEDKGKFKVCYYDEGNISFLDDNCFILTIQSYDVNKEHKTINSMVGKKYKITVEIEE